MSNNDRRHGSASEGRLPKPDEADDAGAYIGRLPERATETIPGGLGPKDQRVSAGATQPSGGEGRETPPEGHRQGERVSEDRIREAGDRD
jgi:hypothetical protein